MESKCCPHPCLNTSQKAPARPAQPPPAPPASQMVLAAPAASTPLLPSSTYPSHFRDVGASNLGVPTPTPLPEPLPWNIP